MPCVKPDGQIPDQCGQAPVRANLSARQAKEWGLLTNVTCGQLSSGSLDSTNLTKYLANRLQVKTELTGSTMYRQTWKQRNTPAGRLHFRLVVSARRIKDKGFTGLPTLNASDNRDRGSVGKTPAVTRRMLSGKQIGWSMLFDGAPCPFCAAAMMGLPPEWVECASRALAMQ